MLCHFTHILLLLSSHVIIVMIISLQLSFISDYYHRCSNACRLRWFSSIKYNIGGQDYSADDIEHGILRGNRPASASLPVLLGHPEWSSGHFKRGDPRLKQVRTSRITLP